ncbi:hypothetical protein M0805_002322 [Coniferiporia weirii]|nr:hypothetical protein M0805_002322 [Coniferiporia weirii]
MSSAPRKTSKSSRKTEPLNNNTSQAQCATSTSTAVIGDTGKIDRPIKPTISLHSFLSSSSKSSLSTASSARSTLSLRSFRATPRKGARLLPRAHKRGGRNKPIVVHDSSSGECKESRGKKTRKPSEQASPIAAADAAENTPPRDVSPIGTLEELQELHLKVLRSLVNRPLTPRSKRKKPYQPLKLGASRPSFESSSSRLAFVSEIEDTPDSPHPNAKCTTSSQGSQISLSQVDVLSDGRDLVVEDTTLVDDCPPQRCVSNGKESVLGLVKSFTAKTQVQTTKADVAGVFKGPNELPGLNGQDLSCLQEVEKLYEQAGQSVVSCPGGSTERDDVPPFTLEDEDSREPIAPAKAIKKVEMDMRKKPMRHRDKTLRMHDSTSTQARPPWSAISQRAPYISGLADSAYNLWRNQQAACGEVAGRARGSLDSASDRENLALALEIEARYQEIQLLRTEISIIEEQMDYIINNPEEHIIDDASQGDEVVFTHMWNNDAIPGTSFNSALLLEEGVLLDIAHPASDSFNSVFRLLDIMTFPLKFVWRLAYRT